MCNPKPLTQTPCPGAPAFRVGRYVFLVALLLVTHLGCRWLPPVHYLPPEMLRPLPPTPVEIPVSNPAHIPDVEPEFLWRQIVDSVDDYFEIASEQPVRRTADLVSNGSLETYPEISGGIFEPWRGEAARGFERIQSTIQTIRRTAKVEITAEATGYSIEVRVIKEQEDVDQSQFSAAGAAAKRHDGTIVRSESEVRQLPTTLGWYEIGRDRILERRILAAILGRISNIDKAPPTNF